MKKMTDTLPVPPEGILCDLDNTLVDTKERDYRSFVDAAGAFGIPVRSYREFQRRRLAGWSSKKIGLEWKTDWQSDHDLQQFLDLRHRYLDREDGMHSDCLFDGVQEALKTLHDAGIPLAVATLRHANGQTRRELERLGIARYLTHVVTADQVFDEADRDYRPEYDSLVYFKGLVLKRACRMMNSTIGKTVFVTDTRFDLEAAHTLSMPSVGVRCGYASDDMLADYAWEILESFADIPARLLPS